MLVIFDASRPLPTSCRNRMRENASDCAHAAICSPRPRCACAQRYANVCVCAKSKCASAKCAKWCAKCAKCAQNVRKVRNLRRVRKRRRGKSVRGFAVRGFSPHRARSFFPRRGVLRKYLVQNIHRRLDLACLSERYSPTVAEGATPCTPETPVGRSILTFPEERVVF